MAKVGAKRAAQLTGKSKSTIQRAMNSGKLSYEIDAHGRRVVDVSELERVFGMYKEDSESSGGGAQVELQNAAHMLEVERLKMRIKMLEKELEIASGQVEDLKDQRDQWQKQASQVLITSQYSQKQAEDLKAQLDARKRRARERRQKTLNKKMQNMKPHNENSRDMGYSFSFSDLWKRAKSSA